VKPGEILRQVRLPGAGGLTLAAEAGGAEEAPLVILSHGGGQTRFSWMRSAHSLIERGYAVLSYDHRGHGQSDWSSLAQYSSADYAADLESIILTVRPGRAITLIGASLGGIASLIAASRHADRVRALVMVDVSPRVNKVGADRIRGFMGAHPQGFATLEEAANAISAYRPERPRPSDLSGLEKNLRRSAQTGRYHWHWDPEVLRGMSPETREQRARLLGEACRQLMTPALLVRGLLSDVVSESEAAHFQSLVPGLERMDVAATGHMVVSDRNDTFLDSIIAFLTRVMPPQRSGSFPNSGRP
jgi:pimeloyl-ACP methyl ester carboxylesterase